MFVETKFDVRRLRTLFILFFAVLTFGCGRPDTRTTVTLWHQMTVGEREVLLDRIAEFEKHNPNIRIRSLYKETEALRSGFQAAALAGVGPDLVFGPADPLGAFVTMELLQDMSPWFDSQRQDLLLPQGLTFLSPESQDTQWLVQVGDRVGNHLAIVYNKNLIPDPPTTTEELVQFAISATKQTANGKQYGLVWNFIEPYFFIPFLTGYDGWVFENGTQTPNLDTQEMVDALSFVQKLQDQHQVLPANCDYETADSLFKEGSAAMIINGDWSWSQYLENEKIDAAVAPLPIVVSTGKPMGPMVATKGYSLNANSTGENAEAAMTFVNFMVSSESQLEFMTRIKTLPSRKNLVDHPVLTSDPTLMASAKQMQQGHPTPVAPEMRAVWDAMRPAYQQVISGDINPDEAAAKMQREAIKKIAQMNADTKATIAGTVIQIIGLLIGVGLVIGFRNSWVDLFSDLRSKPMAYALILPSLIVIAATIAYPFVYNVILSFSNMSLRNFQEWQIAGLQNYAQVFSEEKFFLILMKTLVWTAVCVFFHVTIGLLLACCLNGPLRGKSLYRIVLILPWAIPAYITALTWRGMFNFDYGAINLILTQWFGLETGLNWLGDEFLAFTACIITNVWLGFPFMMVIALGGMQGIPQEMYEAARIDRVPRWQQFWHITLPMLKPVLVPAVTLGSIWTFNNLNVVWLVTNAGEPADETHILVSYVYKAVFSLYQYGYGAALSMIIFVMLLIFSLLFLHRTNATEGVS